jgi:hypothetical protein
MAMFDVVGLCEERLRCRGFAQRLLSLLVLTYIYIYIYTQYICHDILLRTTTRYPVPIAYNNVSFNPADRSQEIVTHKGLL